LLEDAYVGEKNYTRLPHDYTRLTITEQVVDLGTIAQEGTKKACPEKEC
jgi:hypothetical protein